MSAPLVPNPVLVLGTDAAAVVADVLRRLPLDCFVCREAPGSIGRLVLVDDDLEAGTVLCVRCIPRVDELHRAVLAVVELLEAPGGVAA